jgi:hypothetical protein
MLLGGGSNCQQCGCVGPCPPCTRTCQNPQTGLPFQEVSRSYDYGGLATDGYLTFSGDEDNPAFIGDGPFHQAIGGTFDLNSSQTRFPCSLTVSFWRTVAPSDATTNLGLTGNTVTFTCVTGQFQISPGGFLLNPGESYTYSPAVPQVALLSGDPRSASGTFGGFATCDNTQVAVSARIDWSSPERMHVLYGIVRECYEEESTCATFCDGSPPPTSLYLTISNPVVTSGTYSGTFPSGTYVLNRVPHNCNTFVSRATGDCSDRVGQGYWTDYQSINGNPLNSGVVFFTITSLNGGVCGSISSDAIDPLLLSPCTTGVITSGSASWSWIALQSSSGAYPAYGTLDWEVSE